MLDAGVSHCDVTKQDVRTADVIFGSFKSLLQGKTYKRASTPASAVILPRVDCALAAMSKELSGLGIVLDIAGPGQHVPVVER